MAKLEKPQLTNQARKYLNLLGPNRFYSPPRLQFVHLPILNTVADVFNQTQIRWDTIARLISKERERHQLSIRDENDLAGLVLEKHLHRMLLAIVTEIPSLAIHAFGDGEKKPPFEYSSNLPFSNGVLVKITTPSKKPTPYAEYDGLLTHTRNGSPTAAIILESKIRILDDQDPPMLTTKANKHFNLDLIRYWALPILQYFPNSPLSIFVLTTANPRLETTPAIQYFKKNIGVVATVPYTLSEFHEHVRRMKV